MLCVLCDICYSVSTIIYGKNGKVKLSNLIFKLYFRDFSYLHIKLTFELFRHYLNYFHFILERPWYSFLWTNINNIYTNDISATLCWHLILFIQIKWRYIQIYFWVFLQFPTSDAATPLSPDGWKEILSTAIPFSLPDLMLTISDLGHWSVSGITSTTTL